MRLTGLPLLVALAAAVIGLAGVAWRSRRWLRAAAVAAALLSALTFVAADVNRHFSYYRSWRDLLGVHSPDLVEAPNGAAPAAIEQELRDRSAGEHRADGEHRTGTLLQIDIPGPRSGIDRGGFVYLPPEYFSPAFATTHFPVVELLHGSPGVPSDWVLGLNPDQILDGEIATGRAGPMVLVIPDTNGTRLRSSECADAVVGDADETYLTRDVPDFIRERFRVLPTGWGVSGYSTGGYCATNLGLRHQDLYAAVVSLDGYFHALDDRYARGLWKGNDAARLANSPDWEVAHGPHPRLAWYLMAGESDGTERRDTAAFARAVGLSPGDVLVTQPGGRHNFADWKTASVPTYGWLWSHLAPPDLRRLTPDVGCPGCLLTRATVG